MWSCELSAWPPSRHVAREPQQEDNLSSSTHPPHVEQQTMFYVFTSDPPSNQLANARIHSIFIKRTRTTTAMQVNATVHSCALTSKASHQYCSPGEQHACMNDDVDAGHKPFLMSSANNHCVCLVGGSMAPLRQESMLLAYIVDLAFLSHTLPMALLRG